MSAIDRPRTGAARAHQNAAVVSVHGHARSELGTDDGCRTGGHAMGGRAGRVAILCCARPNATRTTSSKIDAELQIAACW